MSLQVLNETQLRIIRTLDYAKRGVFIWEEITEFFYDADSRYQQIGTRAKNLIDTGMWDDPYAYDGTYAGAPEWGERRWATPGVIIDGELVTTNLHHINMGMEEFVEHSYYDGWEDDGVPFRTDPAGNPIRAEPPLEQGDQAPLGPAQLEGPLHLEHGGTLGPPGCRGRRLRPALDHGGGGKMPHTRFLQATGTSVKIDTPQKAALPAMEFEWKIPETWNAFERNRARAYHIVYSLMVAYENVQIAFDLMGQGENKAATMTEFRVPAKRAGRCRVLGRRAGFPHPPPRHGQGRAHQLPDRHAVHLQRLAG